MNASTVSNVPTNDCLADLLIGGSAKMLCFSDFRTWSRISTKANII